MPEIDLLSPIRLVRLDAPTEAALVATLGAGDPAWTWFNTAVGKGAYWNGSAVVYFPADAGGGGPNPVDSLTFVKLKVTDTNATPTEAMTSALTVTGTETNPAPTEAATLKISGLAETNATPTKVMTQKVQYDTAGAATWLCPAGITTATFRTRGGGKGGLNGTTLQGGSGSVGGDFSEVTVTVVPGRTYNLNIGAAGAANGGNGGDSTVTDSVTTTLLGRAKGGGSASANVGDTTFAGGAGAAGAVAGVGGGGGEGAGSTANGGAASGQTGGSGTDGGNGGNGGASGAAGVAGTTPGGGGGGGGFSLTSPGAGAVGAVGRVTVSWTA